MKRLKGSSRNTYKGSMDKSKVGVGLRWEVGVGGAGESGGRKMEATVLEQQ